MKRPLSVIGVVVFVALASVSQAQSPITLEVIGGSVSSAAISSNVTAFPNRGTTYESFTASSGPSVGLGARVPVSKLFSAGVLLRYSSFTVTHEILSCIHIVCDGASSSYRSYTVDSLATVRLRLPYRVAPHVQFAAGGILLNQAAHSNPPPFQSSQHEATSSWHPNIDTSLGAEIPISASVAFDLAVAHQWAFFRAGTFGCDAASCGSNQTLSRWAVQASLNVALR